MSDEKQRSWKDLFPSKYVKADDLDRPYILTIVAVQLVEINDQYEGKIKKLEIAFKGAQKRMLLNKSQCQALEKISGKEDYLSWVGLRVQLRAGKAQNGKQTIIIEQTPKEG